MFGSKRARPFENVDGGVAPGPGRAKVAKEDIASICEITLNKLRLGARAASGLPQAGVATNSWIGKQVDGNGPSTRPRVDGQRQGATWPSSIEEVSMTEQPSVLNAERDLAANHHGAGSRILCYVCLSNLPERTCSHCSRNCCQRCSRSCEGCQESFCSICSTINYEERYDRIFCFDCNSGASA